MPCIAPSHARPPCGAGASPTLRVPAGRSARGTRGRECAPAIGPFAVPGGESGCASVLCARKRPGDDGRSREGECGGGLRCPRRANCAFAVSGRGDARFERGCAEGGPRWSFGQWSRLGNWERRLTGLSVGNARAGFACSPRRQQGGRGGRQIHEARAQRDEQTNAVAAPSKASAISPELDGSGRIKVIGAGAGASAILDFCQQSSLLPSSAQFWYVSEVASEFVLMPDLNGGSNSAEVEANNNPFILQTKNEETIFLVFGVGSGAGLGFVPGQLTAVQSKGSLTVGIFVKPFMFEGAKRLEQAKEVIDCLVECTDVLLVVEQDRLLSSDAVTVSEASSISKSAVLLSIKAVMELVNGGREIFQDEAVEGDGALPKDMKKLFQRSGRAWLGSGRGKTISEAVCMAVSDAPVPDYRPFESKRLVLCTLAGALDHSRQEVGALESILYQALGPELQLRFMTVRNPMIENGLKMATIIVTRCDSRLNSRQIPNSKTSDKHGEGYCTPSTIGISRVHHTPGLQPGTNSVAGASKISYKRTSSNASGGSSVHSGAKSNNGPSFVTQGGSLLGAARSGNGRNGQPQNLKRPQPNRSTRDKAAALPYRLPGREDVKNKDSRQIFSQTPLSSPPSQRSRLAWEAGPSSDVAKAWAQARAEARRPAHRQPTLDISLSFGVRLGEEHGAHPPSESFALRTGLEVLEDKWSGRNAIPVDPDALPRNRMVNIGLEAVRDMYNLASALVMRRETADDGKQAASLSQRAASMLESERSQKKLTPLVEMDFKNGVYKGRCQKGLPEGKGRLSFSDGSFYDGHWKQGKRAGAGAFYYTNGDLFQGSWKDDVMHGKGWMYYHNGDRLYANFWKGKAEGEGRFYSAQGDVLFGQFRENWRHGEFLYIEAAGVRWSELWVNGILNSKIALDS